MFKRIILVAFAILCFIAMFNGRLPQESHKKLLSCDDRKACALKYCDLPYNKIYMYKSTCLKAVGFKDKDCRKDPSNPHIYSTIRFKCDEA